MPTAVRHSDRFHRVTFGSNVFTNTRSFVWIDGEEQMHLERADIDEQLLLTTDIYSADGEHVAKLRRNAWTFHTEDYAVKTTPKNLRLIQLSDHKTLLKVTVDDRDSISIRAADFYGRLGTHVVATPDAVVFNDSITVASNQMEGTNGIRIGQFGFAM